MRIAAEQGSRAGKGGLRDAGEVLLQNRMDERVQTVSRRTIRRMAEKVVSLCLMSLCPPILLCEDLSIPTFSHKYKHCFPQGNGEIKSQS